MGFRQTIGSTFPPRFRGSSAEEATEDVILKQLPEVERLNRSGALSVENVDVFCEKGVFGVAQSRRILEAGQRVGLRVNFHAEELSCLGGAEVRERRSWAYPYFVSLYPAATHLPCSPDM